MPVLKLDKPASRVRNRPLRDYAGQTFGQLTALSLVMRDVEWNNHIWRFSCECGNSVDLRIKSVRQGHTSSCGCAFVKMMVARNSTHGLSRIHPRTYRSWKDMRARCNNPHNTDFVDYGGRGIAVCERWDDFAKFFADMGERPAGQTLDRIDANGDYDPANCRWADAKTQANNKRNNRLVSVNGVSKTLQEWCDKIGIDRSKVRYRLDVGYTIDEALKLEDLRRVNT